MRQQLIIHIQRIEQQQITIIVVVVVVVVIVAFSTFRRNDKLFYMKIIE